MARPTPMPGGVRAGSQLTSCAARAARLDSGAGCPDLQDRKRWEPAEREAVIFARWLASGLFHPAPEGTADENFSIAVPPPNVTGALHMGHALNGSVQDALIRYHRMRGRRAKWILGTDHAGIATQTQVERLLRSEGSSARRSAARRSSSACGAGARSTAG